MAIGGVNPGQKAFSLTDVTSPKYAAFEAQNPGPLTADILTGGGTFTLNGATPVVVSDTRVTAKSVIIPGIKTAAGTQGAAPTVTALNPGVGFTVVGTALDTGLYSYILFV